MCKQFIKEACPQRGLWQLKQIYLKYRRLYELRSKYLSPPLLSSATTVLLCVEESVNISISETYLHGRFMKYNVMLQDNNMNKRKLSFRW